MNRDGIVVVAALLVGAVALASAVLAGSPLASPGGGADEPTTRSPTTAEGASGAVETDAELTSTTGTTATPPGTTEASTRAPTTTTTVPPTDATPNATEPRPFELQVTAVEECGLTCRDVTLTLTNAGEEPATDVVVQSTVFAGSRRLVEGSRRVGRLAPGETVDRTVRVDLDLDDVAAIERNGGYVTIRTAIESVRYRETFTSRERVA